MCRVLDARFACEPEAVGKARQWVRQCLADLYSDLDDAVVDDVTLAVSELVTNCVRADAHELTVAVSAHRGDVSVAITDDAPGVPVAGSPERTDTSGRGLRIVEAITDDWGVEPSDGHKTVWGRFALSGVSSGFDCER